MTKKKVPIQAKAERKRDSPEFKQEWCQGEWHLLKPVIPAEAGIQRLSQPWDTGFPLSRE
jgi:hypothetical protein